MTRQVWIWAVRVLWFVLPLSLQPAIDAAWPASDSGLGWALRAEFWVFFAIGVCSTVLPLPATLVYLRVFGWGAVIASIAAAFASGSELISVIAGAHCCVLLALLLSSNVGDVFVDGASYGDERRMLLRPPAPIMAITPLIGTMLFLSVAAPPLFLASRRWVTGVILSLAGLFVAIVMWRSLLQLARRWAVFVPNGMVFHDLATMTEPVLFRRTAIERLGAADKNTPARDFSQGAAGLLLEVELTDPAPLSLIARDPNGKRIAEAAEVRRFLFAPTKPGALLDEAEARRIACD